MSETSLVQWDDTDKLLEIKKIFAPTLTPTEFQAFVGIGQSTGLNPFLKEIWAVKYGTGAASIFVGRDGYRKGAQKNSEYDWHFVDSIYEKDSFRVVNGQPEHEYASGDRGKLVASYGLCMRKGSSKPNFTGRISFSEYSTGKSLWQSKPETMIKKVAEAQVLRMTFQDMFGGTHDESEEFDNTNVPDAVAPDNLTQRISGKTTEHVEAQVNEVPAEVVQEEEIEVTYISEEQSTKITNLFTQLGYDPAMIIEKRESLERRLGKPYDQFTQEEADSIISNMEKALKKRMEEEKTAEPKEEKKSAVGAMGEKAKAEQEAIKESSEFKAAFPEETPAVETPKEEKEDVLSGESFEEVFGGGGEEGVEAEGLENATEEELRTMRADAKVAFSEAVKKYKADGSNVNLAERTRTSKVCSDINQMLIKKGYDIV